MKRFFLVYILVTACSCAIALFFYSYIYRDAPLHGIDYALKSNEYNDILFIGSSRVKVQVNPMIVDSVTGLQGYCLALDGAGIVELKMLLDSYLSVHPAPKLVVLNIDINMFDTRMEIFNFPDYFPYLKNPVVYATLSPYNNKYRYRHLQGLYTTLKLISLTDNDKINLFLSYGLRDSSEPLEGIRGFFPMQREWTRWADTESREKYVQRTTEDGFRLLNDFCLSCSLHDIRVLFVYAPEYFQTKDVALNYIEIIQRVKAIGAQHGIPFFDYSKIPITMHKDYFYTGHHLNAKGAAIYSMALATDIRSYLLHNTSTKP